MTARPAPPSAMVKAVYKVLRDEGFAVPAGRPGHLSRRLIAAVLDNLPRAEMAQSMFNWPTTDKGWSGINKEARVYWLGKIDAAISAARATLLPGDAT